ncbi:hypothetical protein ACO0LV_11225 [Pseudactinotalea sp. Z1739]|uniref:hypothetical protein n=1 Tax=Pseudactinotalea sp. Z1739 TaxID=3413028 RepID=UPI003C7B9552
MDSLAGVFDGVARMYLAPYEDTAQQVGALAGQAGVRHIVALSGPAESWWGGHAEWYVGTAAETYDPGPAAMDSVPRITGRPATTMTQWVRANAGQFT